MSDPATSQSNLPLRYPIPEEDQTEDKWQFYAEPFEAWRAWRIIDWDGVLVLQSITYKVNWIPRQEFIAECRENPSVKKKATTVHAAPDLNHQCGIYCLKDKEAAIVWAENAATWSKADPVAYGRINIWGHTLNFTKGYLTEFAYPAEIFVPPNNGFPDVERAIDTDARELARELASTYRVEAVTA